jgi:hypothetical protein
MSGRSASPSLSRYRRLICRGLQPTVKLPRNYIPSYDSRFLLSSPTQTESYRSPRSCHLELYRVFALCKYEIFLGYSSVGLYYVYLLLGAYLLLCHMCVCPVFKIWLAYPVLPLLLLISLMCSLNLTRNVLPVCPHNLWILFYTRHIGHIYLFYALLCLDVALMC